MSSVFDRAHLAGALDRARLARVLGMMGSLHDGEVLAAARLAETLRSQSVARGMSCSVPTRRMTRTIRSCDASATRNC
jgi:hypothetical protein